jgi:hypothetical protein
MGKVHKNLIKEGKVTSDSMNQWVAENVVVISGKETKENLLGPRLAVESRCSV